MLAAVNLTATVQRPASSRRSGAPSLELANNHCGDIGRATSMYGTTRAGISSRCFWAWQTSKASHGA
ncbi:hypothetical protein WJX74_005924 [Apatococcus lobatus]|uniref:Uncharacterized protein n=1 Tax=Apatococcus lobatus TaxID=904363 RepID=A0AAW1S7K0_9CHLO